MRWLTALRLRFRSMFHRADVDYELDDELQFHLDHLISTHVARGVEPKEAPYGTVAVFEDLYGNLWDLVQLTTAEMQ